MGAGSSRVRSETSRGEHVEQGPKDHKAQEWDVLKGQQVLLRYCNTLFCFCHYCHSLFGLHPTPSLHFCAMGWQGMWLLPGWDPWQWQISPPASKLCVLTSVDVSVVTTAFSLPLLLRDPHLKQVPILLQTWVEKKVLVIAFSCGRGLLSLVLGFKRIPNVGIHAVFLF